MEKENAKAKKTSKGLVVGLVAAAVVIVIAVVLFIFKPWSPAYVATVDSLKVTKQEYTMFTKFNMTQFLTTNNVSTTAADYWTTTKVGDETAKDTVKKSTLENLQEIKIELAKAKEAGIKLTSDELKKIDDDINQQITSSGGRQAAETAFKSSYGVSLSEYKDIYKDLVLSSKYVSSEQQKITISDDAVKKQYDDNKKDYDKVTVTHILLSTIDSTTGAEVSSGKKDEQKKKAEDLLAQIKAGADIKELAVKNSDDKPAVTTEGGAGYQGEYTFGKGEMVSQFEDWSFQDHKAGDAGIVETSYGYHIIQFQKRAETPFDDIKDDIKSTLVTKAWTEKLDGWKKDGKYTVKPNDSVIAEVDKSLYGV